MSAQDLELEDRPQLAKTLRSHWVWAIAFGSAIGWGSFVLPATWLGQAGPWGTFIGFLIGGALMSIIGVSYGFLIRNFPVSGGEFAYAYLAFGRNHAFLCGWFLTLGYFSIVALNASAAALLAKFTIPAIGNFGFMYSVAGWDVYVGEVAIATIALIAFAYINIRGAALSGKSQFYFCLILVSGGVLIFLGILASPETSLGNLNPAFKPEISAWSAILSMVAIAPWAYVGFDNIPQAAEEFDFPARKAFGLIILAIGCAALFYMMTVTFTAMAMPWQQLVQQESIWGTGDIVLSVLGKGGLFVLACSLLMGIFTGLNGFYVSASRLLFAMGRAGILPPMFNRLHARHNTPAVSIVFVCTACLVAPWFGREVLLWIVSMSATGVTIAYFYACAAAFKLFKWSGAEGEQEYDGVVSPLKKLLSLLGTLCAVGFLCLLIIPGSPGFLATPAWVALLVWVSLGIFFYVLRGKAYREIPPARIEYLILGDLRRPG